MKLERIVLPGVVVLMLGAGLSRTVFGQAISGSILGTVRVPRERSPLMQTY
jgi:hypothetical protein